MVNGLKGLGLGGRLGLAVLEEFGVGGAEGGIKVEKIADDAVFGGWRWVLGRWLLWGWWRWLNCVEEFVYEGGECEDGILEMS